MFLGQRCILIAAPGAPTVNHHDFIPSVSPPYPPQCQGDGPTTIATDNVDPSVPPGKFAVITSEDSLPTPVVTLLYQRGHCDILTLPSTGWYSLRPAYSTVYSGYWFTWAVASRQLWIIIGRAYNWSVGISFPALAITTAFGFQ